MALRLPDETALGRAPGTRVDRRLPPTTPTAFEVAGPTLERVGEKIGSVLEKRDNDAQAFDSEARFIDFQSQWRQSMLDRQQKADPGAPGFQESLKKDYLTSASDFFKSVPDRLKPEYDAKLRQFEGRLTDAGSQYVLGEQKRYGEGQLNDAHQKLTIEATQPGANIADIQRRSGELIDRMPYLTAPEKEEFKRKQRARIAEAGEMGRIDSDPNAATQYTDARYYQGYMDKAGKSESGNNYQPAPTPTSTTTDGRGRYGFLKSTFVKYAKQADPEATAGKTDDEIWDFTKDPKYNYLQDRAFVGFTRDNEAALKGAGVPVNDTTRYLASWFGAGGAAGILKADPSTPIEQFLPNAKGADGVQRTPEQWAAVNGVKGKTVAEVIDIARQRMSQPGAPAPQAGQSGQGGERQFFSVSPDITYEGFQRLQAHAKAVERDRRAEDARDYASYKDMFELGIATNSIAGPETILNDPRLKAGDKASLINSWNSKNKEERQADAVMGKYADHLAGQKSYYNPYDESDKKEGEVIWKRIAGSGSVLKDPRNAALMKELYGATGLVPKDVQAQIRQGLDSKNPADVEKAASLAGWMDTTNPTGLAAANEDIKKAAEKYRAYVDGLGMSSTEAAQRIMADRDPERRQIRDALKKQLDGDKGELAKLDVSDVRRALGQTGIGPALSAGLALGTFGLVGERRAVEGFSPRESAVALADYKRLFEDAYLDSGDPARAKAEADIRFNKLYGVTTVGGTPRLMKFPPERFYPPIDGSHEYVANQAAADIKQATGKDVKTKDILLVPDLNTAREARAGIAPAYQLFYVTEQEGQQIIERAPGDFRPDPATAQKTSTEKRAAEFKAGQEQARAASEARQRAIEGRQPGSVPTPDVVQRRANEMRAIMDEQRAADERRRASQQRIDEERDAARRPSSRKALPRVIGNPP